MLNRTFQQKVEYIISQVPNHDDAYYLIKALSDKNVEGLVTSPNFLDSGHGKRVAAKLFEPNPLAIGV